MDLQSNSKVEYRVGYFTQASALEQAGPFINRPSPLRTLKVGTTCECTQQAEWKALIAINSYVGSQVARAHPGLPTTKGHGIVDGNTRQSDDWPLKDLDGNAFRRGVEGSTGKVLQRHRLSLIKTQQTFSSAS